MVGTCVLLGDNRWPKQILTWALDKKGDEDQKWSGKGKWKQSRRRRM